MAPALYPAAALSEQFSTAGKEANGTGNMKFSFNGALAGDAASLFRPLVDNLLYDDHFLVLADCQAYVDCQEQVTALWRDPPAWTRKSILNVARMGKFSSDRSIRDYCEQVWRVQPLRVDT